MPTVLWPAAVLAAGIALGWVAAGRWQKASARALPPAPGEGMDHLRQIFEHATDGLFLIEVLGEARFRNLAINPALLQSMGMPAHQLVGRMIHETAVPSTATLFVDRYRRCVESGTVQREQISMALPAGRRTVEMTLVPLRDETRRIYQLVGIVHDMTDRVALEATLAAREREFRTLVENSPVLIVRYDRECRRVYVNPAFARMHQQPAESLLGKRPIDDASLRDGEGERVMTAIRDVTSMGKIRWVTGIYRRSGQAWREGDLLLVPEVDSEGRVQTVLGLASDMTAQRQQEAELEQSRVQLRALLSSRLSHELREELGQVLTALRLSAGMLRVQYADSMPPLLAASNTMTELVDRAIATMRELLRDLRPLALDDEIAAGLDGLAGDLRRLHGFECRLDVKAVPRLCRESTDALYGIVQEALENAARHAGVASGELSIECVGGQWELVVRDAGRGFDPAAIVGQGYGLQVMKARAGLLGGELRILSNPGTGTEVRLSFPAVPVKPSPPDPVKVAWGGNIKKTKEKSP
jgi:PAS domain S-box-containing protein